LINVIELEHS